MIVLFDVSQSTFELSKVAITVFSAGVICLLGCILFSVKSFWFWLYAIGSILMSSLFVSSSYISLKNAQDNLRNATCNVVQGQVENFHPTDDTTKMDESFTINGILFSYSEFDSTPGYHNITNYGGIIRPGRNIRIHYKKKVIYKIELITNIAFPEKG